MKTGLFLLYLVAPAIAEFLYPIGTNGKIFWPKGTNVTIQWDKHWPIWHEGPISRKILDLWITTYANDDLAQKLAELTGVLAGGAWDWTVDVPDKFTDGRDLVLRFREHQDGDDYIGDLWQYPSEAFGIAKAIESSSSGTSLSSTSLSSTSLSSTSLSSTFLSSTLLSTTNFGAASSAMPNSTTTSSEHETSITPEIPSTENTLQAGDSVLRGTSPGVIAGAVVGSLLGVMAIVGAVIMSLRRQKMRNKVTSNIKHSRGTFQRGAAASASTTPMVTKHRASDLPEWIVPSYSGY